MDNMKLFQTIKNNTLFVNIIHFNILVFIIIIILNALEHLLIKELTNEIIHYVSVSTNLETLSKKPWTLISHMFVHKDFLHLLFNLIFFYLGGKIFIQYLSQKQLLSTYLMGGIIGSIVYIIAFNVFPVFEIIKEDSIAIGASASVLAILFCYSFICSKFLY